MSNKSTIYRFANIHLNTKNRELYSNNTLVKIEPLLFDLLEVFVQQPRTLITRDDLIEQVWQQGFVDDNAINRAISELRKTLKQHCSATDLLKTHYKKGYSLQIDVEHFDIPTETLSQDTSEYTVNEKAEAGAYQTICPTNATESNDLAPPLTSQPMFAKLPLNKLKFPIVILLLCITLAFVLLKYQQHNQSDDGNKTIAVETKAITWLKGQTVYPTMQRDGDLLAFSYREKATDQWKLIIKNLADDNRSLLDEQNTDFFPLSWHEDTLLYQKTAGDTSEIWLVEYTSTALNHQKLLSLPTTKYSSATLSKDKNELFFIQENSLKEPSLVKAVSLTTGEHYSLSTPRPGSVGDYFLRKSPDGKKLALLRTDNWRKSQIYIIDLDTESTRRVYESDTMLYSIVWQSDSDSLLFMKSPGSLYKLNLYSLELKEQKLSFNKPIEYLALYKNDQLLVTSDSMFYQDIFYKSSCQYLSGSPQTTDKTIVNSSYADFFPTPYKQQLAFVSNRSGTNQIWLRLENKQEKLISTFKNVAKISFLSWSNDGKNLLGMADNQIFILNVKTNHLKYLSLTDQIISSPIWSADGRFVYYAKTHNSQWNIWQYDLTNDVSEQISFSGGVSPKLYNNKGVVFLSESGDQLKTLDSNNKEGVLLDNLNIIDTTAWTIVKNLLYFSQRGKIVSLDIKTRKRTVCDSSIGFANHFSADDAGGFYYTLMANNQTNIIALTLPN